LTPQTTDAPARVLRTDIQALRAVAIAAVLAYHLWPSRIPGGYVGVDVFFVVSGFLITGHLLAEVRRSGTVRLRAFWARRIRRLLPAASVVLGFCLAAMFAIVPPSLWERTVTELAASALYLQNWVLGADSVDYLGADATPTIVQHFWSLSVEEQFYLLWPLLIVGVAAVAGRRGAIAAIGGALAVVLLGSLAFSVLETARSQPSAYFHTGARVWEFAVGGLLVFVPPALRERMPAAVRAATAAAGALLILASVLLFTATTPFPGAWALVPVLGTALVILARPGGRLVGARPLQWLGAVSYPLYLWHWPLIVLTPYLFGVSPRGAASLAIVAVSLLLAWLTTRLVERRRYLPGAHRQRTRGAYALAAALAGLMLVSGAVTTGALQASATASGRAAVLGYETDDCYGAAAMLPGTGCEAPFAVPANLDTAYAASDKGSLALPCSSTGTTVVQCEFGELDDPVRTLALVGNSHAGHLVAGLDAYGLEHGWKVVLMRKTGCTGASTDELTESGCLEWTNAVLEELHGRADIDTVVFATNDDALHYVGDDGMGADAVARIEANVAANLGALRDAGRTVVAVGDVPGAPESAPDCVYLHRSSYDPYFCGARRCHSIIGGAVVYLDEHHLTAAFSRSLGPILGGAIASLSSDTSEPAGGSLSSLD
jgi:peptidoglycan/LPS O-acetylase OafA/YrhL